MLLAFMRKVNNIQEQMDNRNKEIEYNNKEILQIKKIVTEMKNAIDGFIGRQDMVKKSVSELRIWQ